MSIQPFHYYLRASRHNASKIASDTLNNLEQDDKVLGVLLRFKPQGDSSMNQAVLKEIAEEAMSLFPEVDIHLSKTKDTIALSLPINQKEEINALSQMCRLLVSEIASFYLKDMNEPGWLSEYIELQKTLPTHSDFLSFYNPIEKDMFIGMLNAPSHNPFDNSAYEEQEADIRKAILSGYAEDGYRKDLAEFLYNNWDFDSVESALTLIEHIASKKHRRAREDRMDATGQSPISFTHLIQDKLEVAEYSETVDSFFHDLSREFTPEIREWNESLLQGVSSVAREYDKQCSPRDFDAFKDDGESILPRVSFMQSSGMDLSEIDRINPDFMLDPQRFLYDEAECEQSGKLTLVGAINMFLNYADEVKTNEYLLQGLLDISDNALTQSAKDIEHQILELGVSLYSFDPAQYNPLKPVQKKTP